MDLKTLCKALQGSVEHSPNQEVATLQRSVAQLMLTLGAAIPDKLAIFNGLIEDMQTQAFDLRYQKVSLPAYFSGNGPTARLVQQHLNVIDWMDTSLHPAVFVAPGITMAKSTPSLCVSSQMKAFDFQPTDDRSVIRPLSEFLFTVRPTMLRSTYLSSEPALPSGVMQLDKLLTGIYGDASKPEQMSLILRATIPLTNGLEVMFAMIGEAPATIWYYHPFELVWVNGDFSYTFKGVHEALQAEFALAHEKARPVEKVFNFMEELERLEERAGEIFNEEESMAPQLFYYPDGISILPVGNVAPISTYKRDKEASILVVSLDRVHLIFRNTRGTYPMRSRQLCTHITALSQLTVLPDSLPRNAQELLVQKATQALSVYGNCIKSTKNLVSLVASHKTSN